LQAIFGDGARDNIQRTREDIQRPGVTKFIDAIPEREISNMAIRPLLINMPYITWLICCKMVVETTGAFDNQSTNPGLEKGL